MHAHFLAVPTDPAGRFVDRFAVWAPEGLDPDEVAALTAVRSLRAGARAHGEGVADIRPVDLALEAMGGPEVLDPRWIGPAQTWRSFTPFITNRHISASARRRALREGIDPLAAFIESEIRREAALRAWEVETVALVAPNRGRWIDHRRHRAFKAERRAVAPQGFGIEVNFRRPVTGPVALGAMSHLGLGLFHVVAPVAGPGWPSRT
jgi:CRISPR-associated protein Csb2